MAKETPNDTRKEVNIEGNIAGNTQWRMRPHFLKPKAQTESKYDFSISAIASLDDIIYWNTITENISMIFGFSLSQNKIMNTGRSATFGIGFSI